MKLLPEMEGVADNKSLEQWDRLALLLIARPVEDFEPEFEEITLREIERLKPLPASKAGVRRLPNIRQYSNAATNCKKLPACKPSICCKAKEADSPTRAAPTT